MNKFYTLSYSAGFLRSNKFEEKEDAILLGSERAKLTGIPVKVFEYEDKESKTILVCNPDGSVHKPEGDRNRPFETGFDAGKDVASQSHLVLASYEDKRVTNFHLRAKFPETKLKELETTAGIAIGLYDDQFLIAYDQSPKAIAAVEDYLAKAGIEIDRVTYPHYKKKTESPIVVEAAAFKMPERGLPKIKPVILSFGTGSKVRQWICEADTFLDSKTKKPRYLVKVNEVAVGSTTSYRTAVKLMNQEAHDALERYLKNTFK